MVLMSTINKKKLFKDTYDVTLVTAGAIGVTMVAKKVLGMPLNTPETINGAVKWA